MLTSGSHQRSAWRLRGELEVPVWAPALAQELDEEPDERYGHSVVLPGDLVASPTPRAPADQHLLVLDDYVGFVPDLVVNPPDGELALTPDDYMRQPALRRATASGSCSSRGSTSSARRTALPLVDDVHGAAASCARGGRRGLPIRTTSRSSPDEPEEPRRARREQEPPRTRT